MESKEREVQKIRVIIGLGNKGDEYQGTYHNAGSFVARFLKKEHGDDYAPNVLRFEYDIDSYMNTIGVPIFKLLKSGGYALSEECLIIHDEADLPIGEYRISLGGGTAGHKGLRSIVENLGTEMFWRIRIGVRDPREQVRRKAEEFVLKHWSRADEAAFTEVAKKAWDELAQRGLIESSG